MTKTIKGEITEEEAEGALTFEVKTVIKVTDEKTGEVKLVEKWLKADGSLSEEKVELTLKNDFTKTGENEYKLTIEGVEIGSYTVTETTKDVDGKSVIVTTSVDGAAPADGDSTACEVKESTVTTVAFEDDYYKSDDGSDDGGNGQGHDTDDSNDNNGGNGSGNGSNGNGNRSGSNSNGRGNSQTGSRTSSKTGDTSPIGAWAALMVTSAIAIEVIRRRKRQAESNQ